MLSVLLKILTVLGIGLLVLLGILLVLILIILFLPITYRAKGRIEGLSDKEAEVRVNWLFGMLRFKLHYSAALDWQLKFLWLDLKALTEKKKATTSAGQKDSSQKNPNQKNSTAKNANQKNPNQVHTSEAENHAFSGNTENENTENTASSNIPNDEQDSETFESSESKTDKISALRDKLQGIWDKVSFYINLLQEDDTKHLIGHILKVLGKILKSIRPRRLKINALFGFDSPDTTGKVYGFICMLHPYYGKDIHVIPDFERSFIQGDIYIKGRIYIVVLVINALRILLDRKFFKVIHKFKNGGNSKNGR